MSATHDKRRRELVAWLRDLHAEKDHPAFRETRFKEVADMLDPPPPVSGEADMDALLLASLGQLHMKVRQGLIPADAGVILLSAMGAVQELRASRSAERDSIPDRTAPILENMEGFTVPAMPKPEPGATPIRQVWLALQAYHASRALPAFCCSWAAFNNFVGKLIGPSAASSVAPQLPWLAPDEVTEEGTYIREGSEELSRVYKAPQKVYPPAGKPYTEPALSCDGSFHRPDWGDAKFYGPISLQALLKDRQAAHGLMTLLAKARSERDTALSAIEPAVPYDKAMAQRDIALTKALRDVREALLPAMHAEDRIASKAVGIIDKALDKTSRADRTTKGET
jgi:hypothetical protein